MKEVGVVVIVVVCARHRETLAMVLNLTSQ